MFQEQLFISDHIDRSGVLEGDEIILEPFLGRKRSFKLNRTRIDFITENVESKEDLCFTKPLDSVNREQIHICVRQCETKGRNNALKKRYIIESIQGGPVRINGTYVLGAYLERGDSCEIGHNRIEFKAPKLNALEGEQEQFVEDNRNAVESSLSILLEGETGVGKSSLAKKIHSSSRVRGRFVHLNLSSFSENLIESELFGHVKGAFTGAHIDKLGAIREARGGTLFLDEIDSLPLEIQTKLLLFLDSCSARPVGGSSNYKVNVRLIFASGQNLQNLVESRKMRRDFYFRVSQGQSFRLENLRDNTQQIERFCRKYEYEYSVRIGLSLVAFFKTLPLPGNYRQLKGHLDKKRLLTAGKKLDFDCFDEMLIEQSSGLECIDQDMVSSLHEMKKAYAVKIFMKYNQRYSETAMKLRISTKSLKNLLSNYVPIT